jgi:molecular chaperone Hsp33
MGLGKLMTGTLLMASQLSEKQSLSARIVGNGPLKELFAEASFEGAVRAYCPMKHVDIEHKNGHLDLPAAIGEGVVTVARTMPFQKEPHVGIVPITSGEIAQDLAFYLHQSHQIPSVLALSVFLDKHGEVTAAGGVLLELLPGASPQLILELEKKAQTAPVLSKQILAGASPFELLKSYVHDSPLVTIEHECPITYTCKCNNERVERTFLLLGKGPLAEMTLKGEPVNVNCEFCGRKYVVTAARVRELHDSIK